MPLSERYTNERLDQKELEQLLEEKLWTATERLRGQYLEGGPERGTFDAATSMIAHELGGKTSLTYGQLEGLIQRKFVEAAKISYGYLPTIGEPVSPVQRGLERAVADIADSSVERQIASVKGRLFDAYSDCVLGAFADLVDARDKERKHP